MKESVKFGNSLIEFDLEFSERKTLGIKVHPDRSVQVVAPLDSEKQKIFQKVKKKAPWIQKQQDFFLSFYPLTPERKYVSGETHLYLGKQYKLKVKKSESETVKLKGGSIEVNCPDRKDVATIQRLLKEWYATKAKIHFRQIFEAWKPSTQSFYDGNIVLRQRWMSKRWGSCDRNGQVTLNTELIKAPKHCIEYVIAHELCHLAYLNHSRAFYELLEKHLPDWRKSKHKLEYFMT